MRLNGTNDFIDLKHNGDWELKPVEATSVANLMRTQESSIWYKPEGLDIKLFIKSKIEFSFGIFRQYIIKQLSSYGYVIEDVILKELKEDGTLKVIVKVYSCNGTEEITTGF